MTDFAGLDLDVRHLTTGTADRLVDHDPGVRQRVPRPFYPPQGEPRHRGGHAEAGRRDRAADVLIVS